MRIEQLLSIGLATMVTVATIYFWYDRWRGTTKEVKEAFADSPNDMALATLVSGPSTVPSDDEAVNAHMVLLRYISGNLPNGIKFIKDFGKRFYGDDLPLRQNLETRNLVDNYRSPLQ
jgi:hypothetical protein